ncbi:MAG: T9SS type A sorting domain-containing protein [bacterium]|nr:T9SS type A sorting domain-containing protein [bacterium]
MKNLFGSVFTILMIGQIALAAPGDDPACTPYQNSVHWAGEYDFLYYANAVQVVGNLAYVADDGLGLRIIDVSDPTQPIRAGGLEFGAGAEDVVVEEPLVYLATGTSGLRVVDAGDTQDPVSVSNLVLPGAAASLVKRGDLVYISCGPGGLQIVDVSDPAAPFLVGGLSVGEIMRDVALADTVAYVGYIEAGVNTVRAIDVSDPAAPALLGATTTPSVPNEIALAGDLAYVVCGDRDQAGDGCLQILDLTDPTAPVVGAVLPQPPGAEALLLDGEALWTSGALAGDAHYGFLHAFDLTDPALPVFVSETVLRHWGEDISLVNGELCVACGYYPGPGAFHLGSLQVVAKPSLATALPTASLELTYIENLDIGGDLVYVTGGTGLQVIDVLDPLAPAEIGLSVTPGYAHDVAVQGSFAYVADGFDGLQVVDVFLPSAPFLRGVGNVAGTAEAWLVDVAGTRAGLATIPLGGSAGWFEIFDVSDPDAPVSGGGIATTDLVADLVMDTDYAFLAGGDATLRVVDLATPAVVAELPFPSRIRALARGGDLLYVAGITSTYGGCVWVVDVTDPLVPLIVAEIPAPAPGVDMAVGDGLLYMGCEMAGTVVYDLADPGIPTLVGVLGGAGGPLAATTNALYLTSNGFALQIAGLPCGDISAVGPSAAPLAAIGPRAYPNPFNPQATITFVMDRTERVEITVYDLSGRRIAVLADRVLTAGEQSVQWDGLDTAGRDAPSGIYLLRMTTRDRVLGGKATLLR